MMFLAPAFLAFGLLLLLLAVVLLNGQRRNRLELHNLSNEIADYKDQLRTPEERAAIERRRQEIEAQNRVIFGIWENGGA